MIVSSANLSSLCTVKEKLQNSLVEECLIAKLSFRLHANYLAKPIGKIKDLFAAHKITGCSYTTYKNINRIFNKITNKRSRTDATDTNILKTFRSIFRPPHNNIDTFFIYRNCMKRSIQIDQTIRSYNTYIKKLNDNTFHDTATKILNDFKAEVIKRIEEGRQPHTSDIFRLGKRVDQRSPIGEKRAHPIPTSTPKLPSPLLIEKELKRVNPPSFSDFSPEIDSVIEESVMLPQNQQPPPPPNTPSPKDLRQPPPKPGNSKKKRARSITPNTDELSLSNLINLIPDDLIPLGRLSDPSSLPGSPSSSLPGSPSSSLPGSTLSPTTIKATIDDDSDLLFEDWSPSSSLPGSPSSLPWFTLSPTAMKAAGDDDSDLLFEDWSPSSLPWFTLSPTAMKAAGDEYSDFSFLDRLLD